MRDTDTPVPGACMQIEVAILPRDITRLSSRVVLVIDDSAALALRLYRAVVADPLRPRHEEIASVFAETAVGQGLAQIGHAHDTVYCAQIDTSTLVPRLHDIAKTGADELTMICDVSQAG